MRSRTLEWLGIFILLGALQGCSDDDGLCDREQIEDALFRAFRGDTVRVGTCRVSGAFTVPEGVTLAGAGGAASFLSSNSTDPVITALPAETGQATSIIDLTIESTGSAGLLAEGPGRLSLERLNVRASHGIGIGIEDADDVTLSGVNLEGPVTSSNAVDMPPLVTPSEIATHGLVLIDTALADLTDIDATGFAMMGVALVETESSWRGGSSSENRGVGLMVHAGTAELSNLVLCGGLQGLSVAPAYGAMFVEGATVSSDGLVVCETEGVGLFQDSSRGVHSDLSISNSAEAAIWGQHGGTDLELAGFQMSNNGLGGVVLYEVERLTARNGSIEGTTIVSRVFGETGSTPVGDGIQLVRPLAGILLEDIDLVDNERVGLLLQLEGAEPGDLEIDEVVVRGEGTGFGALAQGDADAIAPSWDAGITRPPAIEERDRVQMEEGVPLNLVPSLGAADVPVARELAEGGLDSLLDDFE